MPTAYTVDAKGKSIGRIATEAAVLLMAKNSPSGFKRNAVANVSVRVVNARECTIDPKRLLQKTYHSHSGYPGSDKATMLRDLIAKKGHGEAIRRAVSGMLPKNTLREKRLKLLTIDE